MADLPFDDIDYCKYGFAHRKRTRPWNNILMWTPRHLCRKDCDAMTEDREGHKDTAQRKPSGKKADWGNNRIISREELYTVPGELVTEILMSI